jgi:hypothetical protein
MREAFKALDKDGRGTILEAELRQVHTTCWPVGASGRLTAAHRFCATSARTSSPMRLTSSSRTSRLLSFSDPSLRLLGSFCLLPVPLLVLCCVSDVFCQVNAEGEINYDEFVDLLVAD